MPRSQAVQLVVAVVVAVFLSVLFEQVVLTDNGSDCHSAVGSISTDLNKNNRKLDDVLQKLRQIDEQSSCPSCPPSAPVTCQGSAPGFNREHLIKRYCEQEEFLKDIRLDPYKPVVPHPANNVLLPFTDPQMAWNLWQPLTSCTAMDRVGSTGDGGKWVCEVDRFQGKDCVVYSFGVKDDISFETFFHKQGCETHSFDPTPGVAEQMTPQLKPGMKYHGIALGPVAGYPENPSYAFSLGGKPVKVQNLQEIAASLGHTHIDILKIDIEGSEWDAVPYLLEQPGFSSFKVNQILVELHWTLNQGPTPFGKTARFFDVLQSHGYFAYQKEANLFWTPYGMEYSFIYRGPVECGSSSPVTPTTGRVIPSFVPERLEKNPLEQVIKPMKGALMLDIGANVGHFVDRWLNLEHNRVYMFEPSPQNVEKLRSKYPMSNAHIFPLAVSDKKGELTLYDSPNCPANPSLASQNFWNHGCIWNNFTVEVDTVDNLVDDVVTFMKIDTQGNEERVLNGAKEMMTNNPPKYIHSEFWPNGLVHAGTKPEDLLELFFSYQYYCYNYPDESFNSREMTLIRSAEQFTKSIKDLKGPNIPQGHGPWGAIWCVHESTLEKY